MIVKCIFDSTLFKHQQKIKIDKKDEEEEGYRNQFRPYQP